MKHIRKSAEPPELTKYKKQYQSQFRRWKEHLSKKTKVRDAIHTALAADHKGLCAYCELKLDSQDRSVEHFIPRNQSTPENNLDLDWHNMLATCKGGLQKVKVPGEDALRNSRPPNKFPCCGKAKDDFVPDGQLLNPLELPTKLLFRFSSLDGAISPNPSACEQAGITVKQAQFTIDTLNLNVQRLKEQRLAVMNDVTTRFNERDDGEIDPTELEAELAAEDFGDGSGNWPMFFSAWRFALKQGGEQYLSQFF